MNCHIIKLTAVEKSAIASIAGIFALRMLGLFMIVPLFALYAQSLKGATAFLIGAAMGCYGFSQALLQIPFGWCSDRFGRKPVIAMGLIIFIAGSLIAALSHSIWAVMIGRTLQGAGAIGSAAQALLADLTRPEQRTKGMAAVGITIGISFTLAMIIGPFLSNWLSMAGLFFCSALLGCCAFVILFYAVPTPNLSEVVATKINFRDSAKILFKGELLSFNLGILFLHAILTANFLVLPQLLQNSSGLAAQHQWYFYLPVLLFAFISIAPFLRANRHEINSDSLIKKVIAVLGISQLLLFVFPDAILNMGFSMWLFFSAFTLLEAILPSAVSKLAPATQRGVALGVFSSCQFLGIFLGGIIGGWIYDYYQATGIFFSCLIVILFWFSLLKLYPAA